MITSTMNNELFEYGGDVYVPIETAELLSKAKFNWQVLMTYRDGKLTHQTEGLIDNYNGSSYKNNSLHVHFSAPSLSCVQKWLREKFNIYIDIRTHIDSIGVRFGVNISGCDIIVPDLYHTYEDALLTAINTITKKLIEDNTNGK